MGNINRYAKYRGTDSGRVYTGKQIGYIGLKGKESVEVSEEGIFINSEEFVEEGVENDDSEHLGEDH